HEQQPARESRTARGRRLGGRAADRLHLAGPLRLLGGLLRRLVVVGVAGGRTAALVAERLAEPDRAGGEPDGEQQADGDPHHLPAALAVATPAAVRGGRPRRLELAARDEVRDRRGLSG